MIADQLEREQALDTTKSFLVQAPAGSGKTSLLVQRYLCLLATVEQVPEEIIALTFTRKAAAEMRDRVIYALHLAKQPQAPEDPYQLKLWELARPVLVRDSQAEWDLIDNPARMKIQTIDALCSSITTQMPIITNFGAQPQIETKPEPLYQQAVEQLLQDSITPQPWQEQLNTLLLHLDNDRLKTAKLLISMLGRREQWLPIIINTLSQQDIRQTLEHGLSLAVAEALENLVASCPLELDWSLLPISAPATVDDWLVIAKILLTQDNEWRRTVTEKQGFPAPSSAKNKQEQAQLKANKAAMLLLLEQLQAHEIFKQNLILITKLPAIYYSEQQWSVINALAQVLRVLVAQLTLVFKDSGKVDFTAVSLAASHALDAAELDCKIQHILIDEFQDTSLTQFELLQKLTASWEPYDNKTLFLVGDPMQSIYRFRKAEVSLFLRAKEYGINNIYLNFLQLKVNFRSTPEIIAWNNKVFSNCFPDLDDMTYGAISYMPALAAKSSVTSVQAAECINIAALNEAAYIIQLIKQLKINSPTKTIAVLLRAKSHAVDLLPQLRAAEVAYQGTDLESLRQRPLIQDLLALTKAVIHLDDRIAWLAILRAPWCGLSLADLHIVGSDAQTIWHNLNQPEILSRLSVEGQIRSEKLIAVMQYILTLRGRMLVANLVQTAWQMLGGESCLQQPTSSNEADTYFNLLAEIPQQRDILTLDYLETKLKDLYLQPTSIDKNAVQIMTMHKAKGLEFDIVILPSLTKMTKSDSSELLLLEHRTAEQDYILMAPIKAATEQHDLIYKYLAWGDKQRQQHEELRLLYVAATRAREKIYCLGEIGVNGPRENCMLAKIWPLVANSFVKIDAEIVLPTSSKSNLYRLPISWHQQNICTPKAINTVDLKPQAWQQDWLRIVGIVVHRLFYQLALDGVENWDAQRINNLQPIWQQHLQQLGLPPLYTAQATVLIQQALNNTIADEVGLNILSAKHPESYAEWRLTVRDMDDCKQIILDRAFLDSAGIFWIVDYKIVHDASEVVAAIEQYSSQLYKYIAAVKHLRPNITIKAGLYFPLQRRWHQIN